MFCSDEKLKYTLLGITLNEFLTPSVGGRRNKKNIKNH